MEKIELQKTVEGINAVDWYNMNMLNEAIDIFRDSNKTVIKVREGVFTSAFNKGDDTKEMFVIENGYLVVKMKNSLKLDVGLKFSPFMLLQEYRFKGSFQHALYHVEINYLHKDLEYIRVGIKYFKRIEKMDRYGIKRTELKLWSKDEIKEDLGREVIADIRKYDDFTIVPNNLSFDSTVGNNYNLYAPFEHTPEKGDWFWTERLMRHIFGEQIELGYKYMQILYLHPRQPLPILVLTSQERQTGKSTFIDWISILFGDNMVVINPQDIASGFNGSYAIKNIIGIEESRFESVQATEKLKSLATQKKILVNDKFIPQYSIPFYGKLIITSNDEHKFSKVDNDEIRYWVRKINSLEGEANHNIHENLVEEIPAFIHFLSTLPKLDFSKSRMFFTPEELETDALKEVKKESRSWLHKDIEMTLDEFCMNNDNVEKIYFIASDIKERWFQHNHQVTKNYINRVLRFEMELEKLEQCRYVPLETNGSSVYSETKNGRPYVYDNPYYKGNKLNLNNNNDESEVDF